MKLVVACVLMTRSTCALPAPSPTSLEPAALHVPAKVEADHRVSKKFCFYCWVNDVTHKIVSDAVACSAAPINCATKVAGTAAEVVIAPAALIPSIPATTASPVASFTADTQNQAASLILVILSQFAKKYKAGGVDTWLVSAANGLVKGFIEKLGLDSDSIPTILATCGPKGFVNCKPTGVTAPLWVGVVLYTAITSGDGNGNCNGDALTALFTYEAQCLSQSETHGPVGVSWGGGTVSRVRKVRKQALGFNIDFNILDVIAKYFRVLKDLVERRLGTFNKALTEGSDGTYTYIKPVSELSGEAEESVEMAMESTASTISYVATDTNLMAEVDGTIEDGGGEPILNTGAGEPDEVLDNFWSAIRVNNPEGSLENDFNAWYQEGYNAALVGGEFTEQDFEGLVQGIGDEVIASGEADDIAGALFE